MDGLFAALRQAAAPVAVARIEDLVVHGSDRDLNRINALAFASADVLEDERTIAAFDLVRAHFKVLHEIVAAEAGAVVKTIGDAVMATIPTPDRSVAAALRMREAMCRLNAERGREDLLLKIGIHERPWLAVVLNDRQDYFGQTVDIASRVQGLADWQTFLTTEPIVGDPRVSGLLADSGIAPVARAAELHSIEHEVRIFALS